MGRGWRRPFQSRLPRRRALRELWVKPPPAFGDDVRLLAVDADGCLIVDEVDREVRLRGDPKASHQNGYSSTGNPTASTIALNRQRAPSCGKPTGLRLLSVAGLRKSAGWPQSAGTLHARPPETGASPRCIRQCLSEATAPACADRAISASLVRLTMTVTFHNMDPT